MDDRSPSMLKSTIIGGGTAGVLSSIPFVGCLNLLCCALFVAGGFLAAYLYSKECQGAGLQFTPKSGALVGLVSGLFYAVASTAVSGLVRLVTGPPDMDQFMEQLESQGQDIPPEALETIENVVQMMSSGGGLIMWFFISLLIGAIFCTVGGLIGGAVFKSEAAPPSGSTGGSI